MVYQTFLETSEKNRLPERVSELRNLFTEYAITAYLIPRADAFGNEYVAAIDERLKYISGFGGSWGIACVYGQEADLFVDGRYTLQVRGQTDLTIFNPINISDLSVTDRLKEKCDVNTVIGYDPSLFSAERIKRFRLALAEKSAKLIPLQDNLIDRVRERLHETPTATEPAPVFDYPAELAGFSAKEKIKQITDKIIEKGGDELLITLPESVCWLLNIRGFDIPHTPFVNAYASVHKDGAVKIFLNRQRCPQDLQDRLTESGVHFLAPREFEKYLKELTDKKILCDTETVQDFIQTALENTKATVIRCEDPCLLLKAIKNPAEIAAARQAHLQDGVALLRFIAWFKENSDKGATEIDCVEKLEAFRRASPSLKDISFDTISGAGENGAIVHYRVTKETNRPLRAGDLLLLDSGGQYLEGTTDVTRVFIVGTPSRETTLRYTQVLKAHIAFATARFPVGKNVTGAAIDAITRAPLWKAGIDFAHGTGHGVGSFLSVHEGPQSISSRSTVPLQPGMFVTNEPGYYKQGGFGIRIENIMLITEPKTEKDEELATCGFEALTICPYERRLINVKLLTQEEIDYVNAYHRKVYTILLPYTEKQKSLRMNLDELCAPL